MSSLPRQSQTAENACNRRGYTDTGRREPVPVHKFRSLHAKRKDLEFCILSKCVKKSEEERFE
jgi:hypothetical protein